MENFTYKDINILFEDNHIIVVLKPQNVPCCKDDSNDPDMLSMVKEYIKVTYNKPGEVYIGMVHRLDRVTGGIMVFAKTSKAAERLSADIREHNMRKRYFAVVCGKPRDRQASLTHYIIKDERENKVSVCPMTTEGAKMVQLDYKVLDTVGDYSLVDIDLITGRSHQIRIQMATIGNALYGDSKYGTDTPKKGFKIALFAVELQFAHPTRKEKMVFRAFPPKDELPWKAFANDIDLNLSINVRF